MESGDGINVNFGAHWGRNVVFGEHLSWFLELVSANDDWLFFGLKVKWTYDITLTLPCAIRSTNHNTI